MEQIRPDRAHLGQTNLERASLEDGPALTALAHRAKRHWGYPEAWIEAWSEGLTFGPQLFEVGEIWKGTRDGALLGCAVLVPQERRTALVGADSGPRAEGLFSVEHMWIDPAAHGEGLGRRLFEHLIARAEERGGCELEILSDPNAAGFYRRLGCEPMGEAPADVLGQPRTLPVLRFFLAAGGEGKGRPGKPGKPEKPGK